MRTVRGTVLINQVEKCRNIRLKAKITFFNKITGTEHIYKLKSFAETKGKNYKLPGRRGLFLEFVELGKNPT